MRMRRRNTHYNAWDLVERKRFRQTIQYDLLVVDLKRDLIAQHQSLGMLVQRVMFPAWRRALVITIDMLAMLARMPAARVAGQPRAISVPHAVIPILPRSRHTASIRTRSSMRFTTPTDSNPWFFFHLHIHMRRPGASEAQTHGLLSVGVVRRFSELRNLNLEQESLVG